MKTTSLELSKKLKKIIPDWNTELYHNLKPYYHISQVRGREWYPAPNTDELLERLPKIIPDENDPSKYFTFNIGWENKTNRWEPAYDIGEEACLMFTMHESLPEALGELLLELHKRGLLNEPETNKGL